MRALWLLLLFAVALPADGRSFHNYADARDIAFAQQPAVAAPVNPIPDAANLRGYMEGNNFDGANNGLLANGDPVGGAVPVVNLGTLGGTFTQGTVANQPLFSTTAGPGGSKPAITLDGTDFLVSSLPASSWTFLHDGTGATIYSVVKTSASAVGTLVATGTGGNTSRGVVHRNNTTFRASYFMSDGSVAAVNTNAASATITNGSFDAFISTLSAASLDLYVNGPSVMTAVPLSVSALAPAASLNIGATSAGANGVNGAYRRAMIFQGVHDATMRAAVIAYMQGLDAVTYPAP